MLKFTQRHTATRLRAVSDKPPALIGPPSFVLQARPADDGAMWPALATRCREELPGEMQWAAPLLDARQPLPVVCAGEQVRALFRWLDAQPNTARVSVGCERRRAFNGDSQTTPAADRPA